MIIVFETSDLGRFEIAKSLLNASGIAFVVSGEALQDIIGSRIGGLNIPIGAAKLAVSADDAEAARELLADV